jgi:hypothetical protein
MLKNTFQSRTLFPLSRIGPVTAVTVVVIDLAPGGLLRVEAKFGVRLATLHIATRQRQAHGKSRANPAP